MALATYNKQFQSSQGKEFYLRWLYVDCACENCCWFKLHLKMDAWRSFWERLWAASLFVLACDSGAMISDHGKQTMRRLQQYYDGWCYDLFGHLDC